MIAFIVNGNPRSKERPRKGKAGNFYTPRRTKEWEEYVGWSFKEAGGRMLEGRVAVSMWFYRKTRHVCDLDNLVKCVLDGLNGIAWEDDDCVAHFSAWKDYDSKNPRAEIEIEVMR